MLAAEAEAAQGESDRPQLGRRRQQPQRGLSIPGRSITKSVQRLGHGQPQPDCSNAPNPSNNSGLLLAQKERKF
jgi:hypothetical protein